MVARSKSAAQGRKKHQANARDVRFKREILKPLRDEPR
jgi:hypothetical protein